jgi:hypothetical protein
MGVQVKMSEANELILDVDQLKAMGLHGEALYVIEYDLNSPITIGKNATEQEKDEIKKRNKEAIKIRNKMLFALNFQIRATKHLESSWLISSENLANARTALEAIKEDMRAKGFDNVDKRIRIIPILTNETGFENYEDMKVQFLLQFATEHIQYCDKGLEEQRMPRSSLWRCKKAIEILQAHVESLKKKDAQGEVKDTIAILDDKTQQCEAMILKIEEDTKADKQV